MMEYLNMLANLTLMNSIRMNPFIHLITVKYLYLAGTLLSAIGGTNKIAKI